LVSKEGKPIDWKRYQIMYKQLISSIGSSAFAEVSEKKNKVSVSFFSQVKKAEDARAHNYSHNQTLR
jgi:hypothetical protein